MLAPKKNFIDITLIKPLTKPPQEVNYLFFDYETFPPRVNGDTHNVYMASFVSDREKIIWYTKPEGKRIHPEQMGIECKFIATSDPIRSHIDHMLKNYKDYRAFAHNAANFDSLILASRLKGEDLRKGANPIIMSDSEIKCIYLNNGVQIKDSMKLCPASLKKLAKSFNLSYKKAEFDIASITPENYRMNFRQIAKYCLIDSIVGYEFLGKYKETLSLFTDKVNPLDCMTITSIAYKIFRAEFYNDHRLHHLKHNIYGFCSRAYYGGRVEYYPHHVKGEIRYNDVNALYASQMLQPMPVGKGEFINKGKIVTHPHPNLYVENWTKERAEYNKFFGFIEAHVKIGDCIYAPLPYREKLTSTLNFPTGEFRGVWFSEELKMAVKIGGCEVLTIYRACLFDKAYNLFGDYVKTINSMKEKASEVLAENGEVLKEKDEALYKVAKDLNNYLYGKMGQKPNLPKSILLQPKQALPKDLGVHHFTLGLADGCALAYFVNNEETSYVKVQENYPVQVASAVTAYGRMLLFETIQKIGAENALYMDTDSLITTTKLPEEMLDSKKMGYFKEEEKTPFTELVVVAPKMYNLEHPDPKKSRYVGKGIKQNARRQQITVIKEQILSGKPLKDILTDRFLEERNFVKNLGLLGIQKKDVWKQFGMLRGSKRVLIEGTLHTRPPRIEKS
jgi:hypothetical protein